MSDERKLAIDALAAIQEKGVKPRDAVDRRAGNLGARERGFIMELVYGVLRHRDTLDWMLKRFLTRPPGLRTMNNLRVGVYQIFFLRVPDFAAVNEAVSLERRYKGLANAVLRNTLREREKLEQELHEMELQAESADTSEKDFVNTVSLLTSHPSWMVRRWASRLGRKGAFALARANNEIPSLTLRVNTLMTNREEVLRKMEAEGWKAEATQYSPFGIRLDGTVPFSRLAPFWGLVSVQDEAAQLMSMMLGPKPGERILDACAAPGGKATHLAQIMGDSGEVLAVEVELKRLARLKENIAALGLKSIKVVHDNLLGFQSGQGFDRVMLDAPCSASGVIRRNPDVRYRFREKDLREFGSRQLELLRAGSALLRPGGELLYCTCSTEPEEGEDVVRKFLRTSSEFFIIEDIPSVSELLSSGMLRTYPHIHGTDGFFGVKLGWKR